MTHYICLIQSDYFVTEDFDIFEVVMYKDNPNPQPGATLLFSQECNNGELCFDMIIEFFNKKYRPAKNVEDKCFYGNHKRMKVDIENLIILYSKDSYYDEYDEYLDDRLRNSNCTKQFMAYGIDTN